MGSNDSRPRWSVLLSPMTALALGSLFFLPWLKLSCNATEFAKTAMPSGAPPIPPEMAQGGDMATATGMQLALGEFSSANSKVTRQQMASQKEDFPPPRLWAWGGLALPVLALLLTAGAALKKVQVRTAGKLVLLLAVGGMGVAITAASVDFVDDAANQARAEFDEQFPGTVSAGAQQAMDKAMDQAKEKLAKILQTKVTWVLWTAMGLWMVLGFFGLVMSSADEALPQFRQTPTLGARAAAPTGPGPRHAVATPAPAPAPAVPAAARLGSAEPEPDASDLPDFGPSLTPPAPAPAQEDEPTRPEDRPRSLCEPF